MTFCSAASGMTVKLCRVIQSVSFHVTTPVEPLSTVSTVSPSRRTTYSRSRSVSVAVKTRRLPSVPLAPMRTEGWSTDSSPTM